MNPTDTVQLLLIAALRDEQLAFVDAHAVGTTDTGETAYWWISLARDTVYDPPGLDVLDKALAERGLIRVRDWEPRVTAVGLIRYFSTATTTAENLSAH